MDIGIVGIGHTKFGVTKEGIKELMMQACLHALEDADISFDMVDAVYISNFSSSFHSQCHLPAVLSSAFGVNKEIVRVESACSSGGLALKEAVIGILSGQYKIVLVVGVEKMSEASTSETIAILSRAAGRVEQKHGATFASLFALMAQRHFYEYGTTEAHLASVAVKNHKNARSNPYSHFHYKITIEDVLASSVIASPLKLLDCSPISDGAAAVILCDKYMAASFKSPPVSLIGIGHETAPIDLYDRKILTSLPAVVGAAKKAYGMCGLTPRDIDVAEVHDCFTIAEMIQMEDLGFCERGMSKKLLEEGTTEINGEIPINPSGGLKAKGHPIGATGVSQVVEIVKQLRGEAGERQVSDPHTGLCCNIGGSGASAVVSIFRRD